MGRPRLCEHDAGRYADGSCRECQRGRSAAWYAANRERALATQLAYQRAHPRQQRTYRLRRKYGLTADEFDRIAAEQDGLCAICRLNPPTVVDHDHETGLVRGLLCQDCNLGIGKLRDSADIVERAAEYLRRRP